MLKNILIATMVGFVMSMAVGQTAVPASTALDCCKNCTNCCKSCKCCEVCKCVDCKCSCGCCVK